MVTSEGFEEADPLLTKTINNSPLLEMECQQLGVDPHQGVTHKSDGEHPLGHMGSKSRF